jgi:uncharacterized membrane protein YkoI
MIVHKDRDRMGALASVLMGAVIFLVAACAGTEQGKSYWLRHAVVTLSQAAEIAEREGPGRAVGVELGQSGNRVYYDVEIIDVVNKSRRLRVDAETGKIVKGLSY